MKLMQLAATIPALCGVATSSGCRRTGTRRKGQLSASTASSAPRRKPVPNRAWRPRPPGINVVDAVPDSVPTTWLAVETDTAGRSASKEYEKRSSRERAQSEKRINADAASMAFDAGTTLRHQAIQHVTAVLGPRESTRHAPLSMRRNAGALRIMAMHSRRATSRSGWAHYGEHRCLAPN